VYEAEEGEGGDEGHGKDWTIYCLEESVVRKVAQP